MHRRETTVGRSVIEGTALNTGDEIGIFLMRDSNFSTPYLQNLPYQYAEGGQLNLQPEGTKVYYPARQDTLYLYGYYPYTETAAADEKTVKYPFPLPPLWKQRTPQTTFTPVRPKAARKRLQPQQVRRLLETCLGTATPQHIHRPPRIYGGLIPGVAKHRFYHP